jgi:predicted nucleotidyltransferase
MTDLNRILGQLKEGLLAIYGDRLRGLRLFGSSARNEAVEGSDVDVALILDAFEDSWKEIERTGDLVARICLENNMVISLLPIRERDWRERQSPLLINIRRENVAV